MASTLIIKQNDDRCNTPVLGAPDPEPASYDRKIPLFLEEGDTTERFDLMALLNPESDAPDQAHLRAVSSGKDTITKKTPGKPAVPAGVSEYAAALHGFDVEHRKLRTAFADHLGLTRNEYDAFMFIVEQHTTTPKDLAALLRFTTGATTAMIDRLENVDLVHRIPNPTDRRSVLIEPTPHGATQAGWVIDTYTQIASDAITTYTPLNPKQLTDTITHITTIITTTSTTINTPA